MIQSAPTSPTSVFFFRVSRLHQSLLATVLVLILLGFGYGSVPDQSWAQTGGGIQVVPTRVVFEGRKRTEQVVVINRGTEPATYRIRFKNMRMTEDGEYEDIEQALPNEKFARELIRFSPRQVVIPPGESQVVRLLLRKSKDLPEGEYRSHLFFQSVPPESSGEDIEVVAGDEKKIGVTLIPIFGLTIPVIVRHGNLEATAEIVNAKVMRSNHAEQPPFLSFQISRQGSQSLFGDISVTWIRDKGGPSLEVARVNGIAVFTPNPTRAVSQTLTPPEGFEFTHGKLHIEYKQPGEQGGTLLAEATVSLP